MPGPTGTTNFPDAQFDQLNLAKLVTIEDAGHFLTRPIKWSTRAVPDPVEIFIALSHAGMLCSS